MLFVKPFEFVTLSFVSQLFRLSQNQGSNAASLTVAEQYVNAFNQLARTNNTLILPSNAGDVPSLVGTAMSIYKTIANEQKNENPGNNSTSNDKTQIEQQ